MTAEALETTVHSIESLANLGLGGIVLWFFFVMSSLIFVIVWYAITNMRNQRQAHKMNETRIQSLEDKIMTSEIANAQFKADAKRCQSDIQNLMYRLETCLNKLED